MPVDEFKLRRDAERGTRAKLLLENELLKECFEALKTDYINYWQFTPDHVAREKLWLAVGMIGKVQDHLRQMIANGKLAQKELQNLSSAAEAEKKRFLSGLRR